MLQYQGPTELLLQSLELRPQSGQVEDMHLRQGLGLIHQLGESEVTLTQPI